MSEKARRVAALYCVYGDDSWLSYSLASVYDCVDAVYFILSSKPWYGTPLENSKLLEKIKALPDPDHKIQIQEGEWSDEKEQRNYSLALAIHDGFKFGFIVDADEIYDSSQLSAAISHADQDDTIGCWHIKWITYWKSIAYRIDPIEPYDPPILVRLGRGGFVETRNILADKHGLIPPQICLCHHLSYVRSDESIKLKHIFATGHSQSMRAGWYEQIWKGWDLDHNLQDLHPVTPSIYKRAVPIEPELLPPVLKPLL